MENFYFNLIEFGTPEFDEALALRTEVLRKPLNMVFYEDDIAKEYNETHIGCYNSLHDLVGVLTLKSLDNGNQKMRQVAVSATIQNQGIGKSLVQFSEMYARSKGTQRIELNARDTAVPFYRAIGYQVEGEIFQEVGIDHRYMWKDV